MEWMTRSDIVLLAVAGYVAIMTLVRMMKQRHDNLVADVQKQISAHRGSKKRSRDSDKANREAA
jgi:7-keto-8-aminopelargonate synthetase-like enzyme